MVKTHRAPPPREDSARLGELQATYEEWAEVARDVITRRADLIRLGLAKRRKAGKEQDDDLVDASPLVTGAPLVLPAPAPVAAPVGPAVPIASGAPVLGPIV